jgi:hypothetical protein
MPHLAFLSRVASAGHNGTVYRIWVEMCLLLPYVAEMLECRRIGWSNECVHLKTPERLVPYLPADVTKTTPREASTATVSISATPSGV